MMFVVVSQNEDDLFSNDCPSPFWRLANRMAHNLSIHSKQKQQNQKKQKKYRTHSSNRPISRPWNSSLVLLVLLPTAQGQVRSMADRWMDEWEWKNETNRDIVGDRPPVTKLSPAYCFSLFLSFLSLILYPSSSSARPTNTATIMIMPTRPTITKSSHHQTTTTVPIASSLSLFLHFLHLVDRQWWWCHHGISVSSNDATTTTTTTTTTTPMIDPIGFLAHDDMLHHINPCNKRLVFFHINIRRFALFPSPLFLSYIWLVH
jgi:hypothetical protein